MCVTPKRAVQHRGRQAVTPTYLAHRHAGLIRLAQNLDLLFCCESSILAFAHELRFLCGAPAADRSLSLLSANPLSGDPPCLHGGLTRRVTRLGAFCALPTRGYQVHFAVTIIGPARPACALRRGRPTRSATRNRHRQHFNEAAATSLRIADHHPHVVFRLLKLQ